MLTPPLSATLQECFPDSAFDRDAPDLRVGSFAQWDSLGHFNFLMLVEEVYGVRFSLDQMADLKSLAEIERAVLALVAAARA